MVTAPVSICEDDNLWGFASQHEMPLFGAFEIAYYLFGHIPMDTTGVVPKTGK